MRERLKDEHGAIAVLAALTIVILLRGRGVRDRHQPPVPRAPGPAERRGLRFARRRAGPAGAGLGAGERRERGRAHRRDRERAAGGDGRPHHHLSMRRRRPRTANGIPDPGGHPVRLRSDRDAGRPGGSAKGVGRMVHDCNPFAGDKCNTIRLSTSNSIPYYFAPVIGINTGNTGAVNAASCKGACGAASSPLDVVLVLDRTGSMTRRRRRQREERRALDPGLLRLPASSGSASSRSRTGRTRTSATSTTRRPIPVRTTSTGRSCRSARTSPAPMGR